MAVDVKNFANDVVVVVIVVKRTNEVRQRHDIARGVDPAAEVVEPEGDGGSDERDAEVVMARGLEAAGLKLDSVVEEDTAEKQMMLMEWTRSRSWRICQN